MGLSFYIFPLSVSAERPPKVEFDKVPREITLKAGKDLELEIPYEGMNSLLFLCIPLLITCTE